MEKRYMDLFPLARNIKRHIIFHAGPTNSGKTYAAFEALMSSDNGVYAAPLRLLALEGYEHLSSSLHEQAGMLTGEEEWCNASSTHMSCTVEMTPLNRIFETAVIDEVQMIADDDRGSAWTRAILGVAAKNVHLVGSPETLPIITSLAGMTGDTLEVIKYDRKCDLLPLPFSISDPSELENGDAVIAFSRRSVLSLRARLLKEGISVATVYGDLSPEVRRSEAQRFRSGAAKVLVATDAIGMGLNLPIRRILFSETEKYNGTHMEDLSITSVKQIAGRAGRYGIHETGFFGTFEKENQEHASFLAMYGDLNSASSLITKAVFEPSPKHAREFWVNDDPDEGEGDLCSSITDFYEHYEEPLFRQTARFWDPNRYLYPEADLACALMYAPVRFSRGKWDPARSHKLYDEFAFNRSVKTPIFALSKLKNSSDMQEAESYQHAATLYFWLAKRWPEALPYADQVRKTRDQVAKLMAEALGSEDLLGYPCQDCGIVLTEGSHHALCDTCFSYRYGDYDDHSYEDDGFYEDEEDEFEEMGKAHQRRIDDKKALTKLGPLKKLHEVAQILGVREALFSSWVSRFIVRPTTDYLYVKEGWNEEDINKLKLRVPALLIEHPHTKKEINEIERQERIKNKQRRTSD